MRLLAQSHVRYRVAQSMAAVAKLHVQAAADQFIAEERFETVGAVALNELVDTAGSARWLIGTVAGEFELAYRAVVEVAERAAMPADAALHDWATLAPDTLSYLLPSRYCPSDTFGRFAQREFGALSTGGARVTAILDWLHDKVDYVHGVSDQETTAERTFVDRAGVCRDFTHLGIALCRASGIPARAVGAYALALDPPDFHAVMEVFVGGQWWLFDPTRLASPGGLIRIVHGRDAADIAFLTTAGVAEQVAITVSVFDLG